MRKKLRRLGELSHGELLVLFQLIVLSLVVGVGLRVVALPRLAHCILQSARNRWLRRLPLFHARYKVAQLAILVDWATRIPLGAGPCLTRSLLLLWLIKARGEHAELLIGVAKEDTLYGHAWIESPGIAIGGNPETRGRYVPMLRF